MEAWKRRTRKALATLLLCPLAVQALWPFPTKRFTRNALISAGSLGFDEDGRIVAFGDFNADQSLDMVFLASDQHSLSIYQWDHDAFGFKKNLSFVHTSAILNVIPGDFTYDGRLDLLVMSQGTGKNTDMTVYLGPFIPGVDPKTISVPPSTSVQPIPIDANGDMKIDLLGLTPSSVTQPSLQLWKNSWDPTAEQPRLFELTDPTLRGSACQITNPHSNAVIDLNGDCLADLFLTCQSSTSGSQSYEIWTNDKDSGFHLSDSGKLPPGTGSITFADMDRDGTIDMIFPTCASQTSSGVGSDCTINIAYNKQLPLCSSSSPLESSTGRCRSPENLCIADPNFHFNLTESADNDAFVRIPLSSFSALKSPGLLTLDTSYNPPLPVPLRIGDANLDGFPDLLPIVTSGSAHTPKLLISVECAKGVSGCDAHGRGRRGFRLQVEDVEPLDAIGDARSVAFVDLDEDGTLDILVQKTGTDKVTFIQNNIFFDAFFLKAIVLNGACNGWCLGTNKTDKYHPFGVSYSGATYKYTVLDTSGVRSAAQVGQLPQTGYHSLQTPYSFFGLGRTNNYIENLFVGSTKHDAQHFINMEGVIPNSRVVITPPEGESVDWKKELFLRPGDWIPWVGLTVVVSMVGLAVVVLVLHVNEKREDELERRRASHHINFDAL